MSKALEAARKARQESGAEHLNPQEKFEKKPTRKTAIDAKCYECQGKDADKGVKWRIGNCECTGCGLYPFRPFQSQFGKPIPGVLKA